MYRQKMIFREKYTVRQVRRDVVSAIQNHAIFTLGADAALRFTSGPAGIHRFIVADAIAKRIVQHSVIRYYVAPNGLVALDGRTNELLELGAQKHMWVITEELVTTNLGRLGTLLRVFQPKSTLADSLPYKAMKTTTQISKQFAPIKI